MYIKIQYYGFHFVLFILALRRNGKRKFQLYFHAVLCKKVIRWYNQVSLMIVKVNFWEGKFNFPKCRMYIFFRMSFIVQNLINISQSITYWSRRLMEFDTFERQIPQLMNVKNFFKIMSFRMFLFPVRYVCI